MTKFDYRTKEGREAEVLAEISISGGFTEAWANEYVQRRAAVYRLLADGRIRSLIQRGDFLRFEMVERRQPQRTIFQRIDAWFARFA